MPWPVVRRPSVERRPLLALCRPGGSAFSFNRNSFKLADIQEGYKISDNLGQVGSFSLEVLALER